MRAPLTLAILLLASIAQAQPADHIGRLLARLQLLTGDTHTQATITAADADGITITTAQGETRISRYALPPEARLALDYPAEPEITPVHGAFRIVQVGKDSYIVRLHTPPARAGSVASLNDQIFGRTSISDQTEGKDGDQLYLLKGHADRPLADGDIFAGQYVTTPDTQTFTTVLGSKSTVRVLVLLKTTK